MRRISQKGSGSAMNVDDARKIDRLRRMDHYEDTCDDDGGGYIVWRRGTGDNVEITHLRAYRPHNGAGRRLLRIMLHDLRENPPYATVFGFTRQSNTQACNFYAKMGFELTVVKGVYADGTAVVFSAPYRTLLERHCGA